MVHLPDTLYALTPGTRPGFYESLAPIGKSGMGKVYEARDTRLDRIDLTKIREDYSNGENRSTPN